jgi:serine/threonine protein kinase
MPDEQADFYSLGAVFWEMLCGRPLPIDRVPDQRQLSPNCKPDSREPGCAPVLPHEADLTISKLLAKNPDDRFTSAEEVLATLEEMLSYELGYRWPVTASKKDASPRIYLMLSVLSALLVILWLVVTTVNK